MKKQLAIIGAGELGNQIAHLTEQIDELEVYGFFDDIQPVGSKTGNYNVIGSTKDVIPFFESGFFDYLIIGIGYNHLKIRKSFFELFSKQIPFPNIIHSSCIIDSTAKIGSGVVIYPGCIIDKDVIIDDNVLFNLGVIISHNSHIASHSFFAPGVTIAGFSSIGECCNLGINTTIIDHITIVDYVQTGGGSLVIKNISDSGIYAGSPVRCIG